MSNLEKSLSHTEIVVWRENYSYKGSTANVSSTADFDVRIQNSFQSTACVLLYNDARKLYKILLKNHINDCFNFNIQY